jgi:hypothetical protein
VLVLAAEIEGWSWSRRAMRRKWGVDNGKVTA